jgi:glucosamine-6-phosphate deaminase
VHESTRPPVDRQPAVRVHRNREFVAFAAAAEFASVVCEAVEARSTARILMASAPSQSEFLAAISRNRAIPWDRVDVFHLDEWVGIGPTHPSSLGRYLRTRIPTPPARLEWIRGDAPDPASEATRYERRLDEEPIDVSCVGFGDNGHLAFNEPGAADPADDRSVRVMDLDAASRDQQVADGIFPTLEEVPTQAISVTVSAILSSRHLLAVVPGLRKANAAQQALLGPIDAACPASFVRLHGSASIHLDADAASSMPMLVP